MPAVLFVVVIVVVIVVVDVVAVVIVIITIIISFSFYLWISSCFLHILVFESNRPTLLASTPKTKRMTIVLVIVAFLVVNSLCLN
jgi:hypothetical protein